MDLIAESRGETPLPSRLAHRFKQIFGLIPTIRLAALALVFASALSLAGGAQARYAAIVVDYDTGRVLHEANADTRNYPASLAKMMTLYLVFEALERGDLSLDQKLAVSRRAAGMPAPSWASSGARRSVSRMSSWR